MGYATIVFYDYLSKKSSSVTVDSVASKDAAIALANNLYLYTNAGIKTVSYTEKSNSANAPSASPGKFKYVEQRAIMIFRDDAATTLRGSRVMMSLPAPIDDMFVPNGEKGYRVTLESGEGIQDFLKTATGRTQIKFVRGWLKSRTLQSPE